MAKYRSWAQYTAEDEHSGNTPEGPYQQKKWIVENTFRVPAVLGSTLNIWKKAMVLSKGSFIGPLKVIFGLLDKNL